MRRRLAGACARPEFWMWALFAWLTFSALRSLHSPWMRASLTEWLRWGAGIGLALALGQWLTRTRLAARLLVVCTGIITVLGVWDGLVTAHGGLIGPFRDHQLCGSALLTLLPLTLATGLTAREARWKWGAQAVGMAGLVCLVMTETRSAWIGAAVAGVTFAALWWRRTRIETGRRQAKQLLVPVLLFVGVGLSFITIVGMTELQQPLSARAGSLSALGHDGSWQQRLRAWHGAEQMVAARPLTGWGLGQYPGVQWRFTHIGRILSPVQRPSLSEEAHDLYLQTTAETGLIGVALFLAVLAAFGARAWRALRQAAGQPARSRDGFLVATLALIAGTAVDALASPSYQFAEVSLFVWAALGIGLSALNRREQPEAETATLPAPMARTLRLAASGALSLVLLSQFVPLGLLGPVEAYTAAGYTYDASKPPVITPAAVTASPSEQVPFTLTAHYINNSNGNTENVDVSTDSTTHFNAYVTNNISQTFGADFGAGGSPKNVFTVPATQNSGQPWRDGSTLTITAYFYDSAMPGLKRNGTPATLTIHVTSP